MSVRRASAQRRRASRSVRVRSHDDDQARPRSAPRRRCTPPRRGRRSATARSAGRASRPPARRAARPRRRGSRRRCAPGERPARRSRARAARPWPRGSPRRCRGTASRPAPSARPGGPCASSSSSLWRSRPTISWPSSPPQRTSSGIAAAASAERSSSTRACISTASSARGPSRTCGVATTVRGALGHGRAGQLEAGVHVRRAVVDPGQQVEVEIDGRHRTQSIDTGGRVHVTLL